VSTDVKPIAAAYWQAYNAADWVALREMVTPDYVHHSGDAESHDVEFFVAGAMGLRAAFPDVRVEVREMVAEDDRVAVRWVARATHTGSLFGEPATGRPVTVDGATVYRVVDGRIAEDWEVMNEGALRDQLATEPSATV
jgi:C-1 hydroxylase